MEASIVTAVQEAEAHEADPTIVESTPVIADPNEGHSPQAVPRFSRKRKAPTVKGACKRVD